MSIHLVIQACQAISESGKQPSTALVKTKLLQSGNKIPLALIIRGIRAFSEGYKGTSHQAEAPVQSDSSEECCPTSCQCQFEIEQLKQQLLSLQTEFKELQEQVLALRSE